MLCVVCAAMKLKCSINCSKVFTANWNQPVAMCVLIVISRFLVCARNAKKLTQKKEAPKMLFKSHRLKWLTLYYTALFFLLGTTAMHIPDGYLSPITSLIMFLLVFPFWVIGVRKVRETMSARSVPLIALLAAFSFVIMMFNIPLPGGTSGHAVGATLAAIILGPEVATIAVSIALIIQAFFFGDGGILAIGANCFNMAVVIPYVASAVYRTLSKNTPVTSSRRVFSAAIGGWLGVTIGAFLT